MAAEASAAVAVTEADFTNVKPSNNENVVMSSHSETVAQGNTAVTHKKLILYLKLIVDRRRGRGDQLYFRTAQGY